jgi:cell division protein FtsW (lipid II flippase)
MTAKRISLLVVFLAALATLSGYLMSKASFIGRLGMTYVYKEYRFLKTWWKGALAVFVVWIILLIIQAIVERKLSKQKATIIHIAFILLALIGLYFTYSDFQHTTSHRWLKERFHIGAYLFWLGWIIISVFSLVQKQPELPVTETMSEP